jgi:hypothetical protein
MTIVNTASGPAVCTGWKLVQTTCFGASAVIRGCVCSLPEGNYSMFYTGGKDGDQCVIGISPPVGTTIKSPCGPRRDDEGPENGQLYRPNCIPLLFKRDGGKCIPGTPSGR